MKKVKGEDMLAVKLQPLPDKELLVPMQVKLPKSFRDAVDRECKRRGLKLKQAVVFGLKAFMEVHNPQEAQKLKK